MGQRDCRGWPLWPKARLPKRSESIFHITAIPNLASIAERGVLLSIDSGNVPGCDYRQDDIVHFRANIDDVIASDLSFVFYDYNAATEFATCYDEIEQLDHIDWPLFFETPTLDGYCKFWNSVHTKPRYVRRKETRQAEFLVHKAFPLDLAAEVVARTEPIAAKVRRILADAGCAIPVRAQPLWYY